MMPAMDLMTTIPLLVGAILEVCITAMDALAQRLLTIALSVLIVGGVTIFTVTAFLWLGIKRALCEMLHLTPQTAGS